MRLWCFARRRRRASVAPLARLLVLIRPCGLKRDIRQKISRVTSMQIRVARASLGWSLEQLGERCDVSARTIRRIESENGLESATPANIHLILTTLEAAGVEFVGEPGEGPGVRLWQK